MSNDYCHHSGRGCMSEGSLLLDDQNPCNINFVDIDAGIREAEAAADLIANSTYHYPAIRSKPPTLVISQPKQPSSKPISHPAAKGRKTVRELLDEKRAARAVAAERQTTVVDSLLPVASVCHISSSVHDDHAYAGRFVGTSDATASSATASMPIDVADNLPDIGSSILGQHASAERLVGPNTEATSASASGAIDVADNLDDDETSPEPVHRELKRQRPHKIKQQPLSCPTCHRVFSYKRSLDQHVAKEHCSPGASSVPNGRLTVKQLLAEKRRKEQKAAGVVNQPAASIPETAFTALSEEQALELLGWGCDDSNAPWHYPAIEVQDVEEAGTSNDVSKIPGDSFREFELCVERVASSVREMPGPSVGQKKLTCSTCALVFYDYLLFDEHVETHRVHCQFCGEIFGNENGLKAHTLRRHKADLRRARRPPVPSRDAKGSDIHRKQKPVDPSQAVTVEDAMTRYKRKLLQSSSKREFNVCILPNAAPARKFVKILPKAPAVSGSHPMQLLLHQQIPTSEPNLDFGPTISELSEDDTVWVKVEEEQDEVEFGQPQHSGARANTANEQVDEAKPTFCCCICAYETDFNDRFVRHLNEQHVGFNRSHPELFPFVCNFCDRGFIVESVYLRHIARHQEKPASSLLSKRYTRAKKNKKTRSACCICGSPFRTRRTMSTHLNEFHAHHDAKGRLYDCPVCGLKFGFMEGYLEHLSYHNNRIPFSCSGCGAKFRTRSRLIAHAKLTHRRDPAKCIPCAWCAQSLSVKQLTSHTLAHFEDY